jgi:hypothetical protein
MTTLPTQPRSAKAQIVAFGDALQSRLPEGWSVAIDIAPATDQGRPDALATLTTPAGESTGLAVEYKSRIDPVDVPSVLTQLGRWPKAVPVVIAPFLSRSVRRLLEESRASWADAAGNLRLAIDSPAVFIEAEGATTNPWGRVGPLKSLGGPGAGIVVRSLCDFVPPYNLGELAERVGLSPATVFRVVELLISEAVVEKESRRGPIVRVDWERLLERWVDDYSMMSSNRVTTCLDPRGLSSVLEKLRMSSSRYVVSGSQAVAAVAPAAPTRLLVVYAGQPGSLVDELGLTPVDGGANVFVLEPFADVVFDRTVVRDGLVCAALSQVAADLMTSPGRGPSEAEVLLGWMRANEAEWRA